MSSNVGPKRRRVLQRRDGNRCCYCDRLMWFGGPTNHPLRATIEHVIRKCDGGTNALDNQKLACADCNNQRQDRSFEVWRAIRMQGKYLPATPRVKPEFHQVKLRDWKYLESFT